MSNNKLAFDAFIALRDFLRAPEKQRRERLMNAVAACQAFGLSFPLTEEARQLLYLLRKKKSKMSKIKARTPNRRAAVDARLSQVSGTVLRASGQTRASGSHNA
jgi:hypothetical protein